MSTAPLQLVPYHADLGSFHVASVLVTGQKDAVLIDAQFTLADAHRVVASVLASQKRLTTVYISHGDPDYYFGLEVIRAAFPEARIVATPATVEHIQRTAHKKLDVWGPRLGSNGPKNVILPNALREAVIDLEGQPLEIVGFEGDMRDRTYVWIPSNGAVVGGVAVYGGLHLWTADAASASRRRAWDGVLESIEQRDPRAVVPGHAAPGSPLDASAVRFSRAYLRAFEEELARAGDGAALMGALKVRFPEAGVGVALEIGAKVNKGEMSW